MSINSLTNAAVARRPDFAPFDTVPKGLVGVASAATNVPVPKPGAGAAAPPEQPTNPVNTALNLLFGYIPTEILTLYVAVLAAIAQPNGQVTPGQWTTFWVFLVATPIVVWLVYAAKIISANKPVPLSPLLWPFWEMFAGAVAYFAWAFALPNTPFTQFSSSWYSPSLAGIVVLVASTVLGLLAPFFQRPLKT